MQQIRTTLLRILMTLTLLAVAHGCTGNAHVRAISTDVNKLAGAEPFEVDLRTERAQWFVDDKTRLCVTMESDRDAILGDLGRQSIAASLVLGQVPESGTSTYKLDRQSLRMVQTLGLRHLRWASMSGVTVVERKSPDVIVGRFRIAAKEQSFFIATGWHGDKRTLLLGEFTAVRDERRAKTVLQKSESAGMQREPATAAPSVPRP